MSVFGVVSEFNPFHKGHKYLLDSAFRMGASSVVSVMSGNATQRGELALCDKYYRAEAAVKEGVNLVLELPYPFCSASAEFFAMGAISVLAPLCDTVVFGSECGDIDLISKCADLALGENFKKEYSSLLKAGEQSAAAYLSIFHREFKVILSSNDILGIEYIKAAKRLGANLNFVTVKREGSAYLCDDINLESGEFASAMAIRTAVSSKHFEKAFSALPEGSIEVLRRAYGLGGITDYEKYFDAARFYFRLRNALDFCDIADFGGGIAERVCRLAHESTSGRDFFERISTKRYTDAKLHRSILFALTGVTEDDLAGSPAYTLVLGADSVGRKLLSDRRKKDMQIKIVTKPADVSALGGRHAERQAELCQKLDSIYTFCLSRSVHSGDIIRKKSYIT